jgi:hypothetical protein
MSVGNVTQAVDFNREQLTLVLGENLDQGGDDTGSRNGTGKTTIAEFIVEDFKHHRVVVAALSNKAMGVIKGKLDDLLSDKQFHTLASLFGEKMDMETGMFKRDPFAEKAAPIEDAEIIIIDEASMVNEEVIDKLYMAKRPNAKILFLGDIGQLPPIRSEKNPYFKSRPHLIGRKSPVFNTDNKSRLLERIRQGEGNPILEYADPFWDNSQRQSPAKDPVLKNRANIVSEKGNLLFNGSFDDIKTQVVSSFKKAMEENNPNHIKYVCYRNATREAVNDFIHKQLFGNDAPQFNDGELVQFANSFKVGYNKFVDNSTEGVVRMSEEPREFRLGCKAVRVSVETEEYGMVTANVVAKEDIKKWHSELNKIAENIKTMDKSRQSSAWKDFYDIKDSVADLDYSYAITSHKSQGSTYDIVIVDEQDIRSVKPITDKEKSEATIILTGVFWFEDDEVHGLKYNKLCRFINTNS